MFPSVHLTGVSFICASSSNWCGFCLRLSPVELQGKAGHRKDDEMGGVGQQTGSWGSRLQWVQAVAVQLRADL